MMLQDKVYQRWLVDYNKFYNPNAEKPFLSFDEYFNLLTGKGKQDEARPTTRQANIHQRPAPAARVAKKPKAIPPDFMDRVMKVKAAHQKMRGLA